MIHRAILGSLERFMAIALEHTAGRLPFWLSPRQAVVVPVGPAQNGYAAELAERLYQAGYRARADLSGERMQKKLAVAYDQNYNFVLVVGAREQENAGATVQGRSLAAHDGVTEKPEKHSRAMSVEELLGLFGRLRDGRDYV